jgi:hypothetical protein
MVNFAPKDYNIPINLINGMVLAYTLSKILINSVFSRSLIISNLTKVCMFVLADYLYKTVIDGKSNVLILISEL